MQLIIHRQQADRKGVLGGHKGVMFTLHTRIALTDRERSLLDHYRMWHYPLFSRAQTPMTIRHLAEGDTQTVENVEILLKNEEMVKRALDQVPPLMEVLGSFGGQEIVDYPRVDDE